MVGNRVQDRIVLLFGKHLPKMNCYGVFIFVKKDKFFVFVFHCLCQRSSVHIDPGSAVPNDGLTDGRVKVDKAHIKSICRS